MRVMEGRKSLTDLYEQVRAAGEPGESLDAIRLAVLELRQHRAHEAARRARLWRRILLGGGIALALGGLAVTYGAFGRLQPEPRPAAARYAAVVGPGTVAAERPTPGSENAGRPTPSGDRVEPRDQGSMATQSLQQGVAVTPGATVRADSPTAGDSSAPTGGPGAASSSETFQRAASMRDSSGPQLGADRPVVAAGRAGTSSGAGKPSATEPGRSVADPGPGAASSEPMRGLPKLSALPPAPAAPGQDRPDPAIAAEQAVNQLEAFRRGDHDGAYRYASSEIKRRFGPAAFARMVETSYPEIASYRRLEVGRTEMQPDGTMHVHLTIHGGTGHRVAALYEMVREDGAWKISKVITTASPGPDS
jgi:hypothetical protein